MGKELYIQVRDGAARAVPLSGSRITLGRSASNDLSYPDDPILSRHHLVFEKEGDNWVVQDLGSKNGTILNGERLNGRVPLRIGDRIEAGRVTLTVRDPRNGSDQSLVVVEEDGEPSREPAASYATSLHQVISAKAGGLEVALGQPEAGGLARMQALLDAGRELVGHRPLEELFPLILDLSIRSVGARRGVLMTLEDGKLLLRAARGAGFRISRAVRDRVLEQKASVLVVDAAQDDILRASMTIVEQRIRSLMAVPLQTDTKVIGLIYVDSTDFVRPFTSEDLNLLTVMANVAAIRIENARLVEVEQAERIMSRELERAAEIQRSLLPREAPSLPGFDLAGTSIPCYSVGGDYFDYVKMPGGRMGIIVGDVAGKGMSAAMLMSSLQARVEVLAEDAEDLSALVSRLNHSIAKSCPGNRFISFFIASLEAATGEISFCNAGHNPPFVIRRNGGVERLEAGGPVMGILRNLQYEAHRTRLDPGDMLVLYSDGVTEAQNAANDEFGEERLVEELVRLRDQPARIVVHNLHHALLQFMSGAPASDDITVVVVKRLAE